MNYIKTTVKDKIGWITFNNEEKRNSLNNEMLEEIESALDEFNDSNLRVIIFKSNPNAKVWCAGLSIDELPDPGKDPLPFSHPLENLLRKIESSRAPVIAMITSSVWGGGTDLALTCDMIIGSHESSFAITPAKLGVPYNASGLLHFINVLEMNIIKEMFFTGAPLNSDRAYNIGLLNHLVPKDEIEEFTSSIANEIANNSPLSIRVIKEQLNLLGKARPITSEVMESINELRSLAYSSNDYKEGKAAFMERRKPIFKGD